jgi:hypothetical protein
MKEIANISIPTPCHQSWQQMTPEGDGRHCQSCSKIVTDFTKMTNSQVISHLSTANNVCGRFTQPQLVGINTGIYADSGQMKSNWKRLVLALGIFSTVFSCKSSAQSTPVLTEQGPKSIKINPDSFMLGKVKLADSAQSRIITGRIFDEANYAMPGVTVKLLSGTTGTMTNAGGAFKLTIPVNTQKLQVLFLGYKPLLIDICADTDYQVKLNEDQQVWMGEVTVVRRSSLVKRVYYRCVKRPIRKIFN